MLPLPIPVMIGAGALALVALRMRALSSAKDKPTAADLNLPPQPRQPLPQTPLAAPPPATVEAQLPALGKNPDGSPRVPGTPFVFPSTEEARVVVQEANARAVPVLQVLLEQSGQLLPKASGDGVAALGQRAQVTTRDPSPAGDLIVRSAANLLAPRIGGALKSSIVTVLDSGDATFARVRSPESASYPAVTGFVRKAFLKLL